MQGLLALVAPSAAACPLESIALATARDVAIAGRELRREQSLTKYISEPVRSRGAVIRSRNSDIGQSSEFSCLQVRAPAGEHVNEHGLQFLSAGASHRAFAARVLVVHMSMDLRRGVMRDENSSCCVRQLQDGGQAGR